MDETTKTQINNILVQIKEGKTVTEICKEQKMSKKEATRIFRLAVTIAISQGNFDVMGDVGKGIKDLFSANEKDVFTVPERKKRSTKAGKLLSDISGLFKEKEISDSVKDSLFDLLSAFSPQINREFSKDTELFNREFSKDTEIYAVKNDEEIKEESVPETEIKEESVPDEEIKPRKPSKEGK